MISIVDDFDFELLHRIGRIFSQFTNPLNVFFLEGQGSSRSWIALRMLRRIEYNHSHCWWCRLHIVGIDQDLFSSCPAHCSSAWVFMWDPRGVLVFSMHVIIVSPSYDVFCDGPHILADHVTDPYSKSPKRIHFLMASLPFRLCLFYNITNSWLSLFMLIYFNQFWFWLIYSNLFESIYSNLLLLIYSNLFLLIYSNLF